MYELGVHIVYFCCRLNYFFRIRTIKHICKHSIKLKKKLKEVHQTLKCVGKGRKKVE